jgi:hypothetical protein
MKIFLIVGIIFCLFSSALATEDLVCSQSHNACMSMCQTLASYSAPSEENLNRATELVSRCQADCIRKYQECDFIRSNQKVQENP